MSKETVGYLTAESTFRSKSCLYVKAKCICGNYKLVRLSDWTRGMVQSCGCKTKDLIRKKLIREIPVGTTYGLVTVLSRTDFRTSEGYKYLCQCVCGNKIEIYANRLKRGETKSCGCSSSYLNSINNGGNGVAYSRLPIQKAIRLCEVYQNFIKDCLKRANGKSEFSGSRGEKLHVHHLDSVSYLIKKHELTIDSYLECRELFDMNNAVVLTESEHRAFHKCHGRTTTAVEWTLYKQKELIVVV